MENIFDTIVKLQIQISGNAHSSCHVLVNTLKGTAITLPEVILYYSTLNGTNLQISTPKNYDENPWHLYRGVPPGKLCVLANIYTIILLETKYFLKLGTYLNQKSAMINALNSP